MILDDQKAFTISVEGSTTKEKWTGKFKAKNSLSLRDQLTRDKVRRDLLGTLGGDPDDNASTIAFMVSELTVRIIESPTWWKEMGNGLDLKDENVMVEVFKQVMQLEKDLRDEMAKQTEEAEKDLKDVKEQKVEDK